MMAFSSSLFFSAVVTLVLVSTKNILGKGTCNTERETLTYREGEEVIVRCNATDVSYSEVWWTKDEKYFLYRWDGVNLRIKSVKPTDMGTYSCHVQNGTSNSNSTVVECVNLEVFCSPRPSRFENRYTVFASLNGIAYLEMKFIAYPRPQYKWTYLGKELTDLTVVNNTNSIGIQLTNLTLENFGKYVLTMNNSFGSYTAEYEVIQRGSPGKPTRLTVSEIREDTVTLNWYTGCDYGMPQTFHLMQWFTGNISVELQRFNVTPARYSSNGTQWVTRDVTKLHSDKLYRVFLVGENEYGLGPMSDDVSFKTKAPFRPFIVNPPEVTKLSYIIPVSIFSVIILVSVIVTLTFKVRRKRRNSAAELIPTDSRYKASN